MGREGWLRTKQLEDERVLQVDDEMESWTDEERRGRRGEKRSGWVALHWIYITLDLVDHGCLLPSHPREASDCERSLGAIVPSP